MTLRHPALVSAAALASVAALAAPAIAGPIDASAVPEKAKWVLHIDLEAARGSALGQAVLDAIETNPSADRLRKASDVVGFDLRENVLDATLYGDDFTREAVAMLVDIKGGTGNLEGLMLAAPGYRADAVDNRTVHSFIAEDKKRGDAPRMFVAIQPTAGGADHRLVASYDSEVLHAALDRLEDANAAAAPMPTAPAAGSMVFLLVDDIDPSQFQAGEHSAVLQSIHGLSLDLGETAGRITARAHASATDDQKADQLRQLIQGVLAMAQFGDVSKPEQAAAAELASRTKVSRNGAVVSIQLDASANEVAERVKKLSNR